MRLLFSFVVKAFFGTDFGFGVNLVWCLTCPSLLMLVAMAVAMPARWLHNRYAINPARDLGPRIFSSFVYGSDVWVVDRHWAWIPAVVPLFGGLFGSCLYRATVWR